MYHIFFRSWKLIEKWYISELQAPMNKSFFCRFW